MGRRPKYARDGIVARSAAPAARRAPYRRVGRVPRESPGLAGWPPTFYCYACHSIRRGAEDIRADHCAQCNAFLAELERAYLRAMSAAKAVPKA